MNTRRILGLALVVVAIGVAIVLRSSADSAAKPGDVNEARVLSDAATGNNWLLNGRTFDAGHFSPLQQITDKNIGGLGLAWFLDIPGAMGVVSEPIVVDGVIYLSAPLSKVYAVDAATGKLLWKFDPQVRLDQAINGSYSARVNGGVGWRHVGGGDVCNAITYDQATGLVIFGTAGVGVDYGEFRLIKATGDRLFCECIIAVNADTGEYVWHYQTGAEGVHSENNHILMADLVMDGEKRHVAMTAPKNGFFFVLDAKTGKLLSAKPLVNVIWASSIDLHT